MQSEELVAVKMLRREVDAQLARFDRERRVLADLSHPGIVRYVAHGLAASGEPYLVMEWVEGSWSAARTRGRASALQCSTKLDRRRRSKRYERVRHPGEDSSSNFETARSR